MKNNDSKQRKIANFDPSDIGLSDENIFGLPFSSEESEVVVVPVPWEVTVSYRQGTAQGPESMRKASFQVDLYDPRIKNAWQKGISLEPISEKWWHLNELLRKKAEKCIDHLSKGGRVTDSKVKKYYTEINHASAELNDWVNQQTLKWLKKGKKVVVLGGEHSAPLGYMQALCEYYASFSILHIDAHADLRKAYEGFEFSHASIMYNANQLKQVDRIVMVGVRDYSQQEAQRIQESRGRIVLFNDFDLKRRGFEGQTWQKVCQDVVKHLSKNVYISFDIDALDPALCPHTGTPVPGGLEYEDVFYLFETLLKSGRKIIGFDLCEVAPKEGDEWDASVGARVLYRLCNLMLSS